MMTTPPFSIVIWYLFSQTDGSILSFVMECQKNGLFQTIYSIWPDAFDATAWKMISVYFITEILLLRLVPGKPFDGPVTPAGNVPKYKDNAMACFLLSVVFYLTGAYYLNLYSGGLIYVKFGPILSALNVFSFALCGFLYLKGLYFPSSGDSGSSDNPVFDFYWGTELYPRVFGCDIKVLTNCRWGLMFWAIGPISFMCYQYETFGYVSDSMIVSVALQLVYVAKFFWWESGYMKTMDIMHDRAGYYLCWGCVVWVPAVYTSQALYLASRPRTLGTPVSIALFVAGLLMIALNYSIDEQRQRFRASNGKCLIWGKKPSFISAKYVTENGQEKESLLLTSGWWGVSRHFHYVPEVLGALCWTIPCGFDNILPYFYVVFLTLLLRDRADRDDARCADKYGKYWAKYCERVPNLIFPKI